MKYYCVDCGEEMSEQDYTEYYQCTSCASEHVNPIDEEEE